MTLEGANSAMKRSGKSVQRDVSILERLQNIRAMLIEVRESLGDDSPVEYQAPIEAVDELINDVELEAQESVVEAVTSPDAKDESVEEPAVEETPRRRGRPRKNPEAAEVAEGDQSTVTRRRGRAKKSEEAKELFPFYEQSLF